MVIVHVSRLLEDSTSLLRSRSIVVPTGLCCCGPATGCGRVGCGGGAIGGAFVPGSPGGCSGTCSSLDQVVVVLESLL